MPDTPKPDEFGRIRVKDGDTGYHRSIPVSQFPHGNYTVLKSPASDPRTGDPTPPEFPEATSGQTADSTKKGA